MKFGMVGAGTLSRAIAGHVVKAGHDVVFSNSRGPETLKDVVDAFGLRPSLTPPSGDTAPDTDPLRGRNSLGVRSVTIE